MFPGSWGTTVTVNGVTYVCFSNNFTTEGEVGRGGVCQREG